MTARPAVAEMALDGRSAMSKTVMIVEDNELNMKLFHDLLEAHGYHPIGTRDGMEALDLARKHRPDSAGSLRSRSDQVAQGRP